MMKGRLIVFEGGEGGGKTTQIARSQQWLQDSGWLTCLQSNGLIQDVVVTREPGGTDLGRTIRQLLLNHTTAEPMGDRTELLLYAADRAQHVTQCLRPQLAAGMLILCDRFTDSTVAYQGYGRGLDLALIQQLNAIATQDVESDLTLWLDLDPAIGLARTQARGQHDRMERSELAFHQRVRQGFAQLAHAHPDRMVKIAADQPEAEVAQQIQTVLDQALRRWFGVAPGPTVHTGQHTP